MDRIKTNEGKQLDLTKSDYPIYHEVQTDEGTKYYVTIKTKSGKLCTNATVIPEFLNTAYLLNK